MRFIAFRREGVTTDMVVCIKDLRRPVNIEFGATGAGTKLKCEWLKKSEGLSSSPPTYHEFS